MSLNSEKARLGQSRNGTEPSEKIRMKCGLGPKIADVLARVDDLQCLDSNDLSALKHLIAQSPDRLFRQDRNLRYIWISHDDLFGIPSSEILGRTCFEFFAPDEAQRLTDLKLNIMETGEGARTETNMKIAGKERYFDVFYEPWCDDSGNTSGIAGYIRDITDLRLAESETRRLIRAVEMMPTAVILTNFEGRIEYVNPSILEMSGFSDQSEIIGRNVFDFATDDSRSKLEEDVLPALLLKGQWRGELSIKGRGKTYTVEAICALIRDDHGKPSYFMANYYNITERKRAEEALILDEARLEALLRLNLMEDASLQEITDFALEAGVKLTGSKLGYLAFLDDEERNLTIYSWSKAALQECKVAYRNTVYPLEATGLWGEAVRQRKAIITNDYASSELKKGTPEGHINVLRHMSIPVFDMGRIVAVAGVGNKDEAYDESDVRQLTLLMSGMWRLIQRKRSEEELCKRDRLLQGVAEATNYLLTTDPHAIDKAMEIMGRATEADGVILLENHDSDGEHLCSLALEWVREGMKAQIGSPHAENISYKALFPGWYEILASGRTIQNLISKIQSPGGTRLEMMKIKSFLLVPIFIDGRFSAVIGFGDCQKERRWTDGEIAILQAAAGSIGEAIARRHTEDALRESQRTLSTLMSNLPGMAYRCRNDRDRTMEFVSDGCSGLTGYSPDDLVGNRQVSYAQLIHPDDKEYFWSEIQDALTEKIPFRLTYRIKSLSGTKWVWEQGRGVFSSDGELMALEGFITDITERMLAEEALRGAHDELEKRVQERTAWLLRANEALHEEMAQHKKTEYELRRAKEDANAAAHAKSQFLANMSHEIRTPMNAVIGMSGILLDTNLTPDQRDYVQTIRSSGDGLLSIINDILDFSKIDEGKMDIECQPFDIQECIESSLELVTARASEKKLNLNYNVDEGVPRAILGDVTRLRQVLANLLSNAVKFTETGEVSITVSPGDSTEEIHFSVRDTGIGISHNQMDKLFLSFSQVDTSTSRKYGGTGLGLAISKKLVEMMGGRIWAESDLGKGSEFHFTIHAKAAPHGSDSRLAGRRIIIIVDSDSCAESISHHAESWGMHVSTASSVDAAVEIAGTGDFDAAIIDMQVPGADDLLTELGKTMPLITLSSAKGHGAGQVSLSKPAKLSLLHSAILDAILQKPSASLERAEAGNLRILLAEDNVINQKVALLMLKRLGYRADVAANGQEVLQALMRQSYDVVLMDVQMPEMDGLAAARSVRAMKDIKQPRILAMTAYALEDDKEKCMAAGMDGYIRKPVQLEELRLALEGTGRINAPEIKRE